MKKIIILIVCLSAFFSCKNESKSSVKQDTQVETPSDQEKLVKQKDGLTLLKGEFVYYDGAAVLQTGTEIYGVFVTEKMQELNKGAEKYKTEPTDMVNVEVWGKISNKKDDKILWENKVEIVEVLKITPQSKENKNVVKLGNQ